MTPSAGVPSLAPERGETELPPPQIRVVTDPEARTIDIHDNGCGLTRTRSTSTYRLIGQFG